MAKKSILITGGLGYVGGRLSKHFADQGHQVYALSRSKKVNYPNIEVLSNESVLKESILKDIPVDAVIHLASTNEIECSENPIRSNEVNINGTLKWLKWSLDKNVGQFIYFSTVHVYARPLIGSFSEESICKPAHPYSITHKAAEDYVLWYKRDFGLETKIIRLSNSFGYPAFPTANRWTLFINDICRQIADNHQLEIRSNVEQQRDFISLTKVCHAVEKLLDYQISNTSFDEPIFNLSKGRSKSLMEMGKLCQEAAKKLLKTNIDIIFDESKSQAAKGIYISNEKLKSIGWYPDDNFDKEEISKTIEYFKQNP